MLEVSLRELAVPPAVSPDPPVPIVSAAAGEARQAGRRGRTSPSRSPGRASRPCHRRRRTSRKNVQSACAGSARRFAGSGAAAESPPLAASAPTPRVPQSELLFSYGQTISQALARYKEYPRIAQMQGWEGSVTMRLRVARVRPPDRCQVHASSGHEVLDRQALAMASKPERFPAPPEGLRDREIAVLVPVVFRLER